MTPVGEELLPRESTNLVMLDKILTLCMLGNIFTLLSSADFFQNQLFRKILSGYHQRIKQFGYRLGQRLVGPYLDPNWLPYLSADDPSGQRIVVSGLYKDSHVRQDINSFACWVIFLQFCRLLNFFKINFLIFLNSFRNTIRVSNSLDPGLGPTLCRAQSGSKPVAKIISRRPQ